MISRIFLISGRAWTSTVALGVGQQCDETTDLLHDQPRGLGGPTCSLLSQEAPARQRGRRGRRAPLGARDHRLKQS